MERKNKVNILGVKYSIHYQTEAENKNLKEIGGYCDPSVRKICIRDFSREPAEDGQLERLDYVIRQSLRHEIVHAFFFESGLGFNASKVDHWSTNEEMVDWIALQGPRIFEAFRKCDCL